MYLTFRLQATPSTFKAGTAALQLPSVHLLDEDCWKNSFTGTVADRHLLTLVDKINGLGCIQVQTPMGEWTPLYGTAASVLLLQQWGKRDIPLLAASVTETVDAFLTLHTPVPVEYAQRTS